MRFSQIDGLDVVTRITGPNHHFLGIEFGHGLTSESPVIERVGVDGGTRGTESKGASPDEVCREVARGVALVNERLGDDLEARRIRYCVDDPVVPGVYEELAEALALQTGLDWGPISEEEQTALAAEAFARMDREEAEAEEAKRSGCRPGPIVPHAID